MATKATKKKVTAPARKTKIVEKKKIKKELQPLYDGLLKQRDRIAQGLRTEYEVIEPSELSDWVDLAAASHERELSIILNGNNEEVLMKIDQALEMIEEGTYGVCVNCGKDIAKERLKAIPFTRLCINCQEKLERYIQR